MSMSKVKVPGQKNDNVRPFCLGVILWDAVLVRHFFLGAVLGARNQVIQFCRPPPLRWWENQRMLSSLLDVLNRSLCVIVKFLNKR